MTTVRRARWRARQQGRDLVVVAPFPLSADRGSPLRARRHLAAARKLGLSVRAVAHGGTGQEGVTGCRLPLPATRQAGLTWQKPLFDIELAARTLWQASRRRPAVLEGHVHEGLAIALIARLACRSAAVVYNAHGTLADELAATKHLDEGSLPWRLARRIESWLVRHADAVLAQSDHRAAELAAEGVDPARIVTWPDAPEKAAFEVEHATDGEGPSHLVTCLYTGSLTTYQGIEDILGAAMMTPGVRYIIFGSPSGPYPAIAEGLGVADRIRFVDPAPFEALPPVLAEADIALAPRRYGGNIPGKVPVYQAAGLPVIGTDVAGITELVDDTNGRIVPPEDPIELARAINILAKDPVLRRRLGAEARRQAAERYNEDAMLARLAEAYRIALEHRARRLGGAA